MFSAPIATDLDQGGTDFGPFFDLQFDILPEPDHTQVASLGVGPGAPHCGPYHREIDEGLAALGIEVVQPSATPEGSYEYKVTLLDVNNDGWQILARFRVVDVVDDGR